MKNSWLKDNVNVKAMIRTIRVNSKRRTVLSLISLFALALIAAMALSFGFGAVDTYVDSNSGKILEQWRIGSVQVHTTVNETAFSEQIKEFRLNKDESFDLILVDTRQLVGSKRINRRMGGVPTSLVLIAKLLDAYRVPESQRQKCLEKTLNLLKERANVEIESTNNHGFYLLNGDEIVGQFPQTRDEE